MGMGMGMGMGEGIDPFPFITASYCLAAGLLLSYALWHLRQRRELRQLESVLKEDH